MAVGVLVVEELSVKLAVGGVHVEGGLPMRSLSVSPSDCNLKPFIVEQISSTEGPIVGGVSTVTHQYWAHLRLDGVVVEIWQLQTSLVRPVGVMEEAGGHFIRPDPGGLH